MRKKISPVEPLSPEFDIQLNELEYKYDANTIKLNDFHKFCKSLRPEKYKYVSSWDVYFSASPKLKKFTKTEFIRYRKGERPELTIKIKKNKFNNNNRVEVDLPLNKISEKNLDKYVKTFVEQLLFEENFRILKECYIYYFEKVDVVIYKVYNEDKKFMGQFFEIEARKDKAFSNEKSAWQEVNKYEKLFSKFKITPKKRIKKSQWELWKK